MNKSVLDTILDYIKDMHPGFTELQRHLAERDLRDTAGVIERMIASAAKNYCREKNWK